MTSIDPCEQFVFIAKSYLGKIEVGNNRGDFVDEINKEAGAPIGASWCASFAIHCLNEVQRRFGITTILTPSFHVKAMINANKRFLEHFPKAGWIACWVFSGTINGHCGIVVDVDPKMQFFDCVEGNTEKKDEVERDGGSVQVQRRHINSSGQMRLLGFLRTF